MKLKRIIIICLILVVTISGFVLAEQAAENAKTAEMVNKMKFLGDNEMKKNEISEAVDKYGVDQETLEKFLAEGMTIDGAVEKIYEEVYGLTLDEIDELYKGGASFEDLVTADELARRTGIKAYDLLTEKSVSNKSWEEMKSGYGINQSTIFEELNMPQEKVNYFEEKGYKEKEIIDIALIAINNKLSFDQIEDKIKKEGSLEKVKEQLDAEKIVKAEDKTKLIIEEAKKKTAMAAFNINEKDMSSSIAQGLTADEVIKAKVLADKYKKKLTDVVSEKVKGDSWSAIEKNLQKESN